MRAAILPPDVDVTWATPRAALEDLEVRARVVGVAPDERFDEAIRRALGIVDDDPDAVLLLQVPSFSLLEKGDWEQAGLGEALARAEREHDDRVEGEIAVASQRLDTSDWAEATRHYRAADQLLHDEVSPRHAEVLSALGEVALSQGRTEEARSLFERALSIFPVHQGALRARAAIARDTGESAAAAALMHRLLGTLDDPAARVPMLESIATESLKAAGDAVRMARELAPTEPRLMIRLQAIYEATERFEEAISVAVEIAETLEEPARRARALVAAADLCAARAHNTGRAVALYEAAIEDDPTVERAFTAIEAVLLEASDFQGVKQAYSRQLERLSAAGATDASVELLNRLARVERDQLRDPYAAIQSLNRVTELSPSDTRARADLSVLLESVGEPVLAMRCLEVSAQYEPWQAETYRRLYQLFSKAGDQERTYSACGALVALGAADIDEQLVHAQFAPESSLNPSHGFDSAVWEALHAPGLDHNLQALVAAIEPPAVDHWLAQREARGALPVPLPKHRQDPRKTTVSAVRSFVWASKILRVPEPILYARSDETRLGAAVVPGRQPMVLLGRSVLSGRSAVELSFIAAHHMAYHRPGWRLLSYYTEMEDFEALVRAGLALGRPDLFPVDKLPPASAELHRALSPKLEPDTRERLGQAVNGLHHESETLDLLRWRRAVETVACRAALLACGDVTVAGTVLSTSGAHVAGLTAADRTRDLLAFVVSERHARVRRRLGLSVG